MLHFKCRAVRSVAALLALTMIAPLTGCMGGNDRGYAGSPAPYRNQAPPPRQGGGPLSNMSTGQKLALLGGAAALYYLYKKHQNSRGSGPTGQYYRSKNGRIYYRDANGNPIWVAPPAEGIRVPADEVPIYERGARDAGISYSGGARTTGGYSQGYNGRPSEGY